MGKFLKIFQTHSEYEAFRLSNNFRLPNVSFCRDQSDITHYNKRRESQDGENLTITYFVENDSSPTLLFVGSEELGFLASDIYNSIEIDGNEINMNNLISVNDQETTLYSYQLSTGEHIVNYNLKDPTFIGAKIGSQIEIGATFIQCANITSAEIPNTVIDIGASTFSGCSGLTSITIPDSVTSIGQYAFYDCSSLTSVTVQATTPPTLDEGVFQNNASGRKIYVPAESVNAYKTASGWSEYANDILAIL